MPVTPLSKSKYPDAVKLPYSKQKVIGTMRETADSA